MKQSQKTEFSFIKKVLLVLTLLSNIHTNITEKILPDPTTQSEGHVWRPFILQTQIQRPKKISNTSIKIKLEELDHLFETIQLYLYQTLQVKSFRQLNLGSVKNCEEQEFPQIIKGNFFLNIIYKELDKVPTLSRICFADSRTGRPVAGILYINLSRIEEGKIFLKQNFGILLQEIVHLLGYRSEHWKNYIKREDDYNDSENSQKPEKMQISEIFGKSSIGGKNWNSIIEKNLLKKMKEIYKCQNLKGIPLEENYQNNSIIKENLAILYFPTEIMNSYKSSPRQVTTLTLSLLELTGYYKPNYEMVETSASAEDAGCSYFTSCAERSSQCSTSYTRCSQDYLYKSYCRQIGRSECSIPIPAAHSSCITGDKAGIFDPSFETIGSGSRCFDMEGVISRAGCFAASCINKSQIEIILEGGAKLVCKRSGEIIQIFQTGYRLICPYIEKFCSKMEKSCPQDCNGNGICLKNKNCFCYKGFIGESCNTPSTKNENIKIIGYAGIVKVVIAIFAIFGIFICLVCISKKFIFKKKKNEKRKSGGGSGNSPKMELESKKQLGEFGIGSAGSNKKNSIILGRDSKNENKAFTNRNFGERIRSLKSSNESKKQSKILISSDSAEIPDIQEEKIKNLDQIAETERKSLSKCFFIVERVFEEEINIELDENRYRRKV